MEETKSNILDFLSELCMPYLARDLVQSSLTGLFPLLLSAETYSSVHLVSQSECTEHIKPN